MPREWNVHKRGRKVNGFKMIDEGNVHDFATNDLLRTICYDTRRAWRKESSVLVFGLDNYTCDTSEYFHLMGLGNSCEFPRVVQ
jgi:hypothetical protein